MRLDDPYANVTPISPNDIPQLLALIKHMEPTRTVPTDPDGIRRICNFWADTLTGVDLGFAIEYIKRRYRRTNDLPLTPGEINEAWEQHKRRVDRERERLNEGPQTWQELERALPPWAKELYYTAKPISAQAQLDGVAAGLRGDEVRKGVTAAVAAVPEPESRPKRTAPDPDTVERRCRHWETCVCSHTECRDGWLDAEGVKISRRRKQPYPGVIPCPNCREAAVMAAEMAPPKRGRRR